MASPSTQADYAAFEEKVKRTVYLDNLSPHITEPVVRSALNQFGNVKSVHFIPNYIEPRNIPQCALVEMGDLMQAEAVVSMTSHHYFMVSGMPRPVRARPAEVNMFDDRPKMPGRTIQCQWLDENDPDIKVAQKIKDLTKLNAAQSAFLLKQQLQEEESLAKYQQDILNTNYQKHEVIDNIMVDGTAHRLADRYNLRCD